MNTRTLALVGFVGLGLGGCAGGHPATRSDAPHALPDPDADGDGTPAEAAPLAAPTPIDRGSPPVARSSTGVIPRGELLRVLDAAPGYFLQHVETAPHFVAGRFHGWRLSSFYPGDSRFAGVDLQAGDVVIAVNGQSVEKPEQLMRVWEGLRTGNVLVVSLERDGAPRELRFEIR